MTLVVVLLEGGVSFAWNSGATIALFTVSGVLWIAFVCTEWIVGKKDWKIEPIFPMKWLRNRVWMGTLLLVSRCQLSSMVSNFITGVSSHSEYRTLSSLSTFLYGFK